VLVVGSFWRKYGQNSGVLKSRNVARFDVGSSRVGSEKLPPWRGLLPSDWCHCGTSAIAHSFTSIQVSPPAKAVEQLPGPPSSPCPLSSGVRRSWVPSEPRDLQPVAPLLLSAAWQGVEDEGPAAESVLRCASVASQSVGSLESFRTDLLIAAAAADAFRTTCSSTCSISLWSIGVAFRARIVAANMNSDIVGYI